jgi:YesN/AraC family two-component response regulator
LLEGAIDYILKPISQTDLENLLAKAIKLIDNKRQKSVEMQESNDKLIAASSIIFDKEMSDLIDGDEKRTVHSVTNVRLLEIELNFAKFNLILIKTDSIYNIMKRLSITNSNTISFKIKNRISEIISDNYSIVFNNTYVPNEYVAVVIDKNNKEIEILCDIIINELQAYTENYISIAISGSHFSLDNIREAYNETLIAMMTRKFKLGNYKIDAAQVEKMPMVKYLTAEQENQIIYAVQNNNKKILRAIIYDQMALQHFDKRDFLFLEVKQTIDKIAWLIVNYSTGNNTPSEILESETLLELLNLSIEKFELPEVCSILDQLIDTALKENDLYCSNDNIKKTVNSIKRYISENYFEDLSLTSLAKQFLVDRSYLSKVFKHETSENLMLYIARKRIDKAKEMIAENSATLTDISSLVGYDDYAYFNRVFRKITGKSPRDYKGILQEKSKK